MIKHSFQEYCLNMNKMWEWGIYSGRLWKLRKKLFPQSRGPPTAMLDQCGNQVTDEEEIREGKD